jgi:hypothetical protein
MEKQHKVRGGQTGNNKGIMADLEESETRGWPDPQIDVFCSSTAGGARGTRGGVHIIARNARNSGFSVLQRSCSDGRAGYLVIQLRKKVGLLGRGGNNLPYYRTSTPKNFCSSMAEPQEHGVEEYGVVSEAPEEAATMESTAADATTTDHARAERRSMYGYEDDTDQPPVSSGSSRMTRRNVVKGEEVLYEMSYHPGRVVRDICLMCG